MQEINLKIRLPIAKCESYLIENGWTNTGKQQKLYGMREHKAIDYRENYGAKVLNPIRDGFAMSTYQQYYDENNVPFGLGNCVQIVNENGLVVLAHMSEISDSIPFIRPVKAASGWNTPTEFRIQYEKMEEMVAKGLAVRVSLGEEMGKVGVSGLTLIRVRTIEYNGKSKPNRLKEKNQPSKENPHLHMEIMRMRNPDDGKKIGLVDPYDIYGQKDLYPIPMGVNHMFEVDAAGLPKSADEK